MNIASPISLALLGRGGVLFVRNLLVLAICLYFLLSAVNAWIGSRLNPDPWPGVVQRVSPGEKRPSAADVQPRVDPEVIIERNLFGGSPYRPKESEEESQVALEEIPLAQQLRELRLIGTIVSSDAENVAVVEDRKKRQQNFYVQGDRIANFSIKQILRNNVIVNDGNKDMVLSIDYKARNRLKQQADTRPGPAETPAPEDVISLERGKAQAAVADMNSLLQQARIRPVISQGRPQGFQISQIQRNSFFHQLQLQNGDIIQGTQDMELSNPQQLFALTRELQHRDTVKLKIKRGGRDMILEYHLR